MINASALYLVRPRSDPSKPRMVCIQEAAAGKISDFVKFKGRIFAVDQGGHIYVLDHTNLQLVQATDKCVREFTGRWVLVQFVVSDGDLYVVWVYHNNPSPSPCEVYRLQVLETDGITVLSEKVEDLGDRVFFLTNSCAFSMPAPLLPHPWRQGNCIFIPECARSRFTRLIRNYRVFHFASRTLTGLRTPEGHSYLDPLFMNKHY